MNERIVTGVVVDADMEDAEKSKNKERAANTSKYRKN